jgi:hypothetical protein
MIKPEPVRWLVPGRVPLGKLVLIAGDGGHGKSTLTLTLAADLTRGRPSFGQDDHETPPASVLLISCEDDFADTVVPRLLAAGADLSRISKVDGIRGSDGTPAPFNLGHYVQLKNELKARPAVRLVVIDPATAYVGRSGVDDHKDSALRALLGPLAELAAECDVTIILVMHVNKGTTAKAVYRVVGSAAYVNSVRAGYLLCPDPDDGERKLFLPLKFNVGLKPAGLAFRMQALCQEEWEAVLSRFDHLGDDDRRRLGEQLFRIAWEGEVDVEADAAMAPPAKDRGPTKTAAAADWILDYLRSRGPTPSNDVIEAGEKAGFSERTLWNAKKLVRDQVRARKTADGWSWHLTDAAFALSAPLHPSHPSHPCTDDGVQGRKGVKAASSANVQTDSHEVFPEDGG